MSWAGNEATGNIVTGKGASLEVRLGQKSGFNPNLEGSNTDLMTPSKWALPFLHRGPFEKSRD